MSEAVRDIYIAVLKYNATIKMIDKNLFRVNIIDDKHYLPYYYMIQDDHIKFMGVSMEEVVIKLS